MTREFTCAPQLIAQSGAEECRKLAKIATRAEDWAHFSEMAETWELLAKQRHDEIQFTKTLALAESIASGRRSIFPSGQKTAA
jgi:hypothetical protein